MRKLAYAKVLHTSVPGVMEFTRQFYTAKGLFYLEMMHLDCTAPFELTVDMHHPELVFPVVFKGDVSLPDPLDIVLQEWEAVAEIVPPKAYSTTIQPGKYKVLFLLPAISTVANHVSFTEDELNSLCVKFDVALFSVVKVSRRKKTIIRKIADCTEAIHHERDAKIWAMMISLIKLYVG
ncbi:hypothetical protein LPB86_17010 [Pedobacter sp. MC2016-14]|uniref:hypothetical protein n=1 Tax=Pedobacter sp. MC2016-14 TaxID=2897327 RepID=UPI001E5C19BA|nr:hypothetical protein [Pedobacter sp. MC2016-14]MCD0489945.1 hypothetical protein [Pedobacter sp. MC2016-14]